MIIGIGTDMTAISRVADVIARHGGRFVERCFAPQERAPEADAAHYAKRWAAKEACAKALGTGIRDDIYLKDIAVTRDEAGRPALGLSGGAKKRLDALVPRGMIARIDVSLSDDAGLALAFVVISAEKEA